MGVLGFWGLDRVAFLGVGEAHHHVAVSDGVDLVDLELETALVELGEEGSEHCDHLLCAHA